ncbi:MAG: T9SS type A sorting domain-containing protein [Salinivirgaceae bacterium]|nr:T9SS type A sorting domain-containing protein [Salinivirgaceae bacterium]
MKKTIIIFLLLTWLNTTFAQTITWTPMASLTEGYRNGEAVVLNNKIYFVAGCNNSTFTRFFYVFDPVLNIWTKLADLPGPTMNLALASVNGKIYAIGGDSFRNTNYEYNPLTNSWLIRSQMPTSRQHIDCGVYEDNIYVIGGLTSWTAITKKNEVYDPATNVWSEKCQIPSLRNNPAIVTVDSLIYVIGGGGNDTNIWTNIATVECYNVKSDTWVQKADLPYTLFKPGAVVVNNKILVLGGVTTLNGLDVCTNKILLYNDISDEWTEITPLPEVNIFFGCVSIENKIYVIAGQYGLPPSYGLYATVYEGEFNFTNIKEHDQKKIELYPNPAQGKITIKNLDCKDEIIYKLIDINGHISKQGKVNNSSINISDLHSGLYSLVLEKNNCQLFQEKFVVE